MTPPPHAGQPDHHLAVERAVAGDGNFTTHDGTSCGVGRLEEQIDLGREAAHNDKIEVISGGRYLHKETEPLDWVSTPMRGRDDFFVQRPQASSHRGTNPCRSQNSIIAPVECAVPPKVHSPSACFAVSGLTPKDNARGCLHCLQKKSSRHIKRQIQRQPIRSRDHGRYRQRRPILPNRRNAPCVCDSMLCLTRLPTSRHS